MSPKPQTPNPKPQTPNSDPFCWFVDEVQPHAAALRAYVKNAFPSVSNEADDVVQDSLLRVWLVRAKAPIQSVRGLLYTIARHCAIDVVRRSKRVLIEPPESLDQFSGAAEQTAEWVSRDEKVRLLAQAIDGLPARCREVLVLRKLRCIPQREVARRLGISEKTVEAQLSRGIKRVEDRLRRLGVHHYYDDSHE